jgi:phage terminase large subunit-like protein
MKIARIWRLGFQSIVSRYESTRIGRQEINAEILTDVPRALWNLDAIDRARRERASELQRIVVASDPAVSPSRSRPR